MCGIVGYLGNRQATDVLVDGLSKLEYRGYDSAGVAVNNGKDELEIRKYQGRLAVLAEDLEKNPIQGHLGIGHTRWATHGVPSDVNSHPHFNKEKTSCQGQACFVFRMDRSSLLLDKIESTFAMLLLNI